MLVMMRPLVSASVVLNVFATFGFILVTAVAATGDVRLVEAAAERDAERVRELLSDGVDVDSSRADGTTALHWAAHLDAIELVDLLVGAGVDVDASTDNGVTPLALACENRSVAVVERLLEAGADANVAKTSGETPLMMAARTGNVGVVEALLAHGASVNRATSKSRQTALMWATAEGNRDIVGLLIEAGADVHPSSAKGFTPLLFAVRNGDMELTQVLLDAGAEVNDPGGDGTHALPLAVVSGRDELAVFLLEQGADPNGTIFGIPALHAAAAPVGMWLREWLHLRRAGVTQGLAPFDLARRPALVKTLLAHGADPNGRITASTTTLFFTKVSLGAFDLFSNGTGNLRGATPLWVVAYAAQGGQRINVGADDLKEDAGTPEVAPSYTQIMQILLDAGADPSLATDDGTTPLMAAAGLGHGGGGPERPRPQAVAPVKLLLDAGADVNVVNEAGFTALHGAAFVGINEVVQLLVDQGAKLDAQDFMERTPFRIAEGAKQQFSFRSSPHTAELLRDLGADTELGVPGEVLERQLQRDADQSQR